jgi:hypothetical protein
MGKTNDADDDVLIDDIEHLELEFEEEATVLPPPPPAEALRERGEFEGWERGEEDLT